MNNFNSTSIQALKRSKGIEKKSQSNKKESKTNFKRYECSKCKIIRENKMKVCNQCRNKSYCSEECQKLDWKIHRLKCCVPNEFEKQMHRIHKRFLKSFDQVMESDKKNRMCFFYKIKQLKETQNYTTLIKCKLDDLKPLPIVRKLCEAINEGIEFALFYPVESNHNIVVISTDQVFKIEISYLLNEKVKEKYLDNDCDIIMITKVRNKQPIWTIRKILQR